MSKHVRMSDLVSSGTKVTGPIEFDPNDLTSLNDRDSADAIYARLYGSNGFTVNELTSQGTNGHETVEEKQKKKDRQRDSLSDLFDNGLFGFTGAFRAIIDGIKHNAAVSATAALSKSFKDTSIQFCKETEDGTYQYGTTMVSDEVYELLAEDMQAIEQYIAEYKTETDPAKRAQMVREIQDYAGYARIMVDLEHEEGPVVHGYEYGYVRDLQVGHFDRGFAPACHNKVCVWHDLRHSHSGGLNNKTAPETADPDDVDGIVGNDKQQVAVVVTKPAGPPPPALHLH